MPSKKVLLPFRDAAFRAAHPARLSADGWRSRVGRRRTDRLYSVGKSAAVAPASGFSAPGQKKTRPPERTWMSRSLYQLSATGTRRIFLLFMADTSCGQFVFTFRVYHIRDALSRERGGRERVNEFFPRRYPDSLPGTRPGLTRVMGQRRRKTRRVHPCVTNAPRSSALMIFPVIFLPAVYHSSLPSPYPVPRQQNKPLPPRGFLRQRT